MRFFICILLTLCFIARVKTSSIPSDFGLMHWCVNEDTESASCLFIDACYEAGNFSFHCDDGRCVIPNLIAASGPLPEPFRETFIAKTYVQESSQHDHVFVILQPFWFFNTGHVIANDVFCIFRVLSLFGLKSVKRVTVLSLVPISSYPQRALEVFDAAGLELVYLRDLGNRSCFRILLHGIKALEYNTPLGRGGGMILDEYRDWFLRRANLSVSFYPEQRVSIIKKHYATADHPQGIGNADEILSWVQASRRFTTSERRDRLIDLHEVSFREQLRFIQETDVLVVAPGSDVVISVFLRNGARVVLVPLCGNTLPCGGGVKGHEYDMWFKWRASVVSLFYRIDEAEVRLNKTSDSGISYYQIFVDRGKILSLIGTALSTVELLAAAQSDAHDPGMRRCRGPLPVGHVAPGRDVHPVG